MPPGLDRGSGGTAVRARNANCAISPNGAGLVVIDMRGAIHYPRWRIAACPMRPWDAMLDWLTTFGAVFIALSAVKPRDDGGHAPGSLAR